MTTSTAIAPAPTVATPFPRPRAVYADLLAGKGRQERVVVRDARERSCEVEATTSFQIYNFGRLVNVAPGERITVSRTRVRFFPPKAYTIKFQDVGQGKLSWDVTVPKVDREVLMKLLREREAFHDWRPINLEMRTPCGGAIFCGFTTIVGFFQVRPVDDEAQNVPE